MLRGSDTGAEAVAAHINGTPLPWAQRSARQAVRRVVRFDVTLSVIATGLYRWLGKHLHGFEHAKARQIFRRFLDTTAKINVAPDGVHVHLPRRAHNPLLLEAGLLTTPIAVPWWGGASLKVVFP